MAAGSRLSKFVALFAVLIVAVSCSSSKSSTGNKAHSGGTLTLVVGAVDAEDFDPVLAISAGQHTYLPLIYDPLITKDPQTGELTPGLLTKWEAAADGSSWTLTLRDGVKFSDGSAFTADDVKFSLERYIGKVAGTKVSALGGQRLAGTIGTITVVDPHTLKIDTPKGWPTLPTDLSIEPGTTAAYSVPMADVQKMGEKAFNASPIGTGPFKLVSHSPGREMVFARNDNYWGTKANVDKVDLKIVSDVSARLALLKSGQADIVTGIVGPAIKEVEADKSVKVVTSTKGQIVYMLVGGITTPGSPTGDIRVRNALSLAIDRQGIVTNLLDGHGAPATLLGFPFSFGYPADAPTVQYAPDQAKTLLSQAGFTSSHPLQLNMFAPTVGKDFAEAIAQSLQNVGVKINLRILDIDAVLNEGISDQGKKRPRLVLYFGDHGSGARVDIGGILNNFFVPADGTDWQPSGDKQLIQWATDQFSVKNRDDRGALITKILLRIYDQKFLLPLYYVDTIFAVAPRVAQWQPINGVGYPSNLASVQLSS